jgi:protoporphyrinogen/coproporphyrinogen III oxidase
MRQRDVVVLGGGLSGLTAALQLRHLDVEVVDAASWVGGRTRSARIPDGPWINYGAQYITEDRPVVVELADRLGVELVRSEMFEDYYKEMLPKEAGPRAEAEAGLRRILEEQSRPRPLTLPELDDQSFADWLGPMSEEAADYFDRITLLMNCASTVDLSMVGGLWVWGDQRTGPWNTPDIPHHDRGELVVAGGTSELAKALAREIGGRVSLRSRVANVRPEGSGYLVELTTERGPRTIAARRVVCALPGPVAARVLEDLPGWKRDALLTVHYGRWISTPIVVAPAGRPAHQYPLVASRPRVRYNADGFMARTPGDVETEGGCYHSFMADAAARVVWDDPDDSIKSGAVRAFQAALPQFADRIERVDLHRWEFGHPQYVRGLMKQYPLLAEPVDGIFFAGDYTWQANMEGAVTSGQRAAEQLQALGTG